jgi:adenylate kinase family enzyme
MGWRIVVVGAGASGKTTLARELSQRLHIPHVALDELQRRSPGWDMDQVKVPTEVFRQRTEQAIRGDSWVVDGGHSAVRDIVWSRANTLVWLDYALPVIVSRALRRTLHRIVLRPELRHGGRLEELRKFFSRHSILPWAVSTHRRYRRMFPALVNQPEYAHLNVVHLRSAKATREWFSHLPCVPPKEARRGEPSL